MFYDQSTITVISGRLRETKRERGLGGGGRQTDRQRQRDRDRERQRDWFKSLSRKVAYQ